MTRPRSRYDAVGSGLPPLAFIANCHVCDRTYVSALYEFPIPYVCRACEPEPKPRHCPQGHLLTGETTYTDPGGKQSCRICRALALRDYQERQSNGVTSSPETKVSNPEEEDHDGTRAS